MYNPLIIHYDLRNLLSFELYNKTYLKNSSNCNIVYVRDLVLTNTSSGFQKYGDGNNHANDGFDICSSRITLPRNANEPRSSPN